MNAPQRPLGVQTWSSTGVCSMSELPPKAEVDPPSCDVAKATIGDICNAANSIISQSITSSAATSKPGGTIRPSCFAVLRFTTVSYLVGSCTGRSTDRFALGPRQPRAGLQDIELTRIMTVPLA